MWQEQVAALEADDVRVITPDLPGHGERRHETFSIPAALAVLDEVAADIDGPFLLAGLSLGGYLALHWAARTARPDAVLAAGCTVQPHGSYLWAYRTVTRLIGALPDGGRALNQLAASRLPDYAREDLAEGGMTIAQASQAIVGMSSIDALADVAQLRCPVWFVNGRWDHFRFDERRFLAAARRGRLLVLPRANHLVSLTNPTAFNRVLLDMAAGVRRLAAARHLQAAQPNPVPR